MSTETAQKKSETNAVAIAQEMSNKIRVLESQVAIVSSQRDAAMTKVSELAATVNVLLQDFETLRQAAESVKSEAGVEIERLEKELQSAKQLPTTTIKDNAEVSE